MKGEEEEVELKEWRQRCRRWRWRRSGEGGGGLEEKDEVEVNLSSCRDKSEEAATGPRSLAEAPNQIRLVGLEPGETQVEELENPRTGRGKNYGIATMLKAELPMLRVIHQKQQLQGRGVVSPVFHPGRGWGWGG